MPPPTSPLPNQIGKTYSLLYSIYSLCPLTHFPHVPLSCHIFPHNQSIFLRLYRSPMTANTSWLSKRRSHALELSSICPLFHDSDEIFKLHFCSFLIGCQYTVCEDKMGGGGEELMWSPAVCLESGQGWGCKNRRVWEKDE